MSHNNEILSKKRYKSNFVVPVFIGAGIGALMGLVAYVKDWF
ncbi:hypothetical protein [Metabacillus indicus]|nr:hypothetical protein [Metabacillus indicus]KEZ50916.1 membrane protein [Metabacillus indicus LMG 22858]